MRAVIDREVLGQPSWILSNDVVEMAVTQRGAHMAPVLFACGQDEPVDPYHISPWQGESFAKEGLWSEVVLRGDFFCMPFGNGEYAAQEEVHPSHGETSGAVWSLDVQRDEDWRQTLEIGLTTTSRAGRVTREFSLVDGENVVYDRTSVHGFAGPVTMAHHAVLRAPRDGSQLLLSTSGMQFGMVYPHPFGDPAVGEYQSLQIGAEFTSLARIPSIYRHQPDQDCSVWPARRGFTDLIQVASAIPPTGEPAWTAAVNAAEGYLWFALKDAHVLPSTIVWMENAGRHKSPWLGRNCALGLEDACTFFDRGIQQSSTLNAFSERGVRTHHELHGDHFEINYAQGIVKCPNDFGRVVKVEFNAESATFFDADGNFVQASVQKNFVLGGPLRAGLTRHPR